MFRTYGVSMFPGKAGEVPGTADSYRPESVRYSQNKAKTIYALDR